MRPPCCDRPDRIPFWDRKRKQHVGVICRRCGGRSLLPVEVKVPKK